MNLSEAHGKLRAIEDGLRLVPAEKRGDLVQEFSDYEDAVGMVVSSMIGLGKVGVHNALCALALPIATLEKRVLSAIAGQ